MTVLSLTRFSLPQERSSGSYGGGSSSFRDSGSRGFEEYNAGDDEVVATSPTRNNSLTVSSPSSARFPPARKSAAPEPAPAPVPEVDLLGGLDDDTFSSGTTSNPPFGITEKALPAVGAVPAQNSIGIDGAWNSTLPFYYPLTSFQTMILPISKLHQSLLILPLHRFKSRLPLHTR